MFLDFNVVSGGVSVRLCARSCNSTAPAAAATPPSSTPRPPRRRRCVRRRTKVRGGYRGKKKDGRALYPSPHLFFSGLPAPRLSDGVLPDREADQAPAAGSIARAALQQGRGVEAQPCALGVAIVCDLIGFGWRGERGQVLYSDPPGQAVAEGDLAPGLAPPALPSPSLHTPKVRLTMRPPPSSPS